MSITSTHAKRDGLTLIEMDRIVSRREAADFLGVSVSTMDRWQREGTGPVWVKITGRTGGYTVDALAAFIRSRTVPPRERRAA